MSTGSDNSRGFWRSPAGLTLAVFFVAAAFYLWLEHRAHTLGILPLLLPLLVCVGMHFFMHRGHGNHRGHGGGRDEQ